MGLEVFLLMKNTDRKGPSDTSSAKCNQSVTKSSAFALRINRSNQNKEGSFVLCDCPIESKMKNIRKIGICKLIKIRKSD